MPRGRLIVTSQECNRPPSQPMGLYQLHQESKRQTNHQEAHSGISAQAGCCRQVLKPHRPLLLRSIRNGMER